MITSTDVNELLSRWWFAYDEALFDEWPDLFTAQARFTCRTDTGTTDFEEFVRADISGRDELLAWQTEHRKNSPDPLRHNGENIHLTAASATEATFRSYIWVTQVQGGFPTPLSTAIVTGTVAIEDDALRIAELHVALDTQDSVAWNDRHGDGG
jgi:hypothetical protein